MDIIELTNILDSLEGEWEAKSHDEAKGLIDKPVHNSVGEIGSQNFYQVEINAFYDDPISQSGDIRIMISVDDGGRRAFKPLVREVIISE